MKILVHILIVISTFIILQTQYIIYPSIDIPIFTVSSSMSVSVLMKANCLQSTEFLLALWIPA